MNATVFDTYQKDIMSKLQPETCFGHVPFQAGRHAEFEETMRAGHDAVERWLLTASPFVYPYGRGRHGDFDELSADEERTMLPQWTAVIVLRVSAGGNSAIIPIVFGGGNFRNEMASPVKPIKTGTPAEHALVQRLVQHREGRGHMNVIECQGMLDDAQRSIHLFAGRSGTHHRKCDRADGVGGSDIWFEFDGEGRRYLCINVDTDKNLKAGAGRIAVIPDEIINLGIRPVEDVLEYILEARPPNGPAAGFFLSAPKSVKQQTFNAGMYTGFARVWREPKGFWHETYRGRMV
ncbi:hypothetical protein RI054_15g72270 [Pseudoscourfieldia marina]